MSFGSPPTNSSTCEADYLQDVPYYLSCGVPLLANGSSVNSSSASTTTSSAYYPNNNTALLLSCCASKNSNPVVAPYPSSYPGDVTSSCYIYCNNSDMAQALQTYWCLGNLSATTKNENVTDGIVIFGCGFTSGAAAGRRGSGGKIAWLGMGVAFWVLVMGLVV